MPTLAVGYNATTRVATVVVQGESLPVGSTNVGTFAHPDATYPDSYVIFHGVRDVLYKRSAVDPTKSAMFPDNITDLDRVSIESDLLPPVKVTEIYIVESNVQVDEEDTVTLTVGFNPTTATNRSLTFESSDEDVATVSSTGVVTGVANGTATITATSDDGGHEATITVTVTQPELESLDLSPASLALVVGGTGQLTAVKTPVNGNGTIVWSTDDSEVATVSENGEVTAVGEGTANITATVGTITDSAVVTVTEESGDPDNPDDPEDPENP